MAKKSKNLQYYESVGRRKEAVARVRLYIVGKEKTVTVNENKIKAGEVYINNKPAEKTFSKIDEKITYLKALQLTNNENRFAVSILVKGGGKNGQLESVALGIARAIEKSDKEQYRPILKKQRLLTRDSRTRERRKIGTGGKARRAKQSPKR